MNIQTINKILGINESYQAPQKMLELMIHKEIRVNTFNEFLKHEQDLSYEWFQSYFEDEHADRKTKKQDFTPNAISKLGSKILGESESYFEAAAGTGGMMIQFWRNNPNALYELEELSERSVPFLLFNMAIRNINGILRHGDSLEGDFTRIYKITAGDNYSDIEVIKESNTYKHLSVLMNPPYSAKWSSDKKFLEDHRFNEFERLAPKSKADFAFLLHGYSKLKDGGKMAVVLPHGVLFRGATEGVIRKKLLEIGAIESVIGLPANLFYGTSIPTVYIILQKGRREKDVLFIDASKEFEKGKNQNYLKDEHVNKILEVYQHQKTEDKYSHLASFEEIKDNDFNLNIPRYVDTFEEPEPIDMVALSKEIIQIDKEIVEAESNFLSMLNELVSTDGNDEVIEATKAIFKESGRM